MDVLIRYGFTIDEIKSMMDANEQIDEVHDQDVSSLIELLEKVGCTRQIIKNIFLCNPFFLSRNGKEVQCLLDKLYEIGCTYLYLLFDHNPYLLSYKDTDIEAIYNQKRSLGFSKDEILDELYSNIFY